MKEIRDGYLAKLETAEEKKRFAIEKAEKASERVENKRKELAKAEEAEKKAWIAEQAIRRPTMYEEIIEPLANKLSDYFGMEYEIYGPFGVECETSIYLRKDMSVSICDQPTISLVLRPDFKDSWLCYNTGEKVAIYPKGSVGDANGLNDVYAPLPFEFDEIVKLVTNDFETGVKDND